MNKPPIAQKPVLKPKPPAKPADLKGKLSDLKLNDDRDKVSDLKPNDGGKLNDPKLSDESKLSNRNLSDEEDQWTERSTVHNGKSSMFNELDRLSQESTSETNRSAFSQKVLDAGQLQKALQLLNQSGLPEKENVQYDIRVDEDQIETCQQIISALLEAGYFRANIVGLSEFDKVSLLNGSWYS